MKKILKLAVLLVCLCATYGLSAQNKAKKYSKNHYRYPYVKTFEAGFALGATYFLGDLGGTPEIGSPLLRDTEWKLLRPFIGGYFGYNFHKNFSVRAELNFTALRGDDKYTYAANNEQGFYRQYRNLSVRSRTWELSVSGQATPYYFDINEYQRIQPWFSAGIGVIHFRPQASLDYVWYDLQPLGTEGQGLAQFPGRDKYKLWSLAIPVSIGVRYIVYKRWTFGIEFAGRMTFSDYLDDVSTNYVDPALFYQNYDYATANLIERLADRSYEIDPARVNGYITSRGAQRGDPNDNDHYFSFIVRCGIMLGDFEHVYEKYRKDWRINW